MTTPAKRSDERATALAEQVWERCVGSRVTRLHRMVALRYDQALATTGLTLPQVEILAALVMRGRAVRPSEMGQNLAVGRSAMSRKLGAMEERGWVETAERSDTGRSMSFAITPAGVAMLAQADSAWATAQAEADAILGEGAAQQLDEWLARMSCPTTDSGSATQGGR